MLFKDWMKIDDWLIWFKCLNTRNKHAKEVLLIYLPSLKVFQLFSAETVDRRGK